MSNLYFSILNKCHRYRLVALALFSLLAGSQRAHAQIEATDFVVTINTSETFVLFSGNGISSVYYESIPGGLSGFATVGLAPSILYFEVPAPGKYRIAFKPGTPGQFGQIRFDLNPLLLLTIEQWGTSLWDSFAFSFFSCVNLSAIPATDSPNLTNVSSLQAMFLNCTSLSSAPNIKNWDVGQVTSMRDMFGNCPLFNEQLNSWNVTNAIDMSNMFQGAAAFNQSLGDWTLNATVSMDNIFAGSGVDCFNYSNTLIGWAANPSIPASRSLGAPGLSYGPDALAARDFLVQTKNWTITGDTFDNTCIKLPVKLVSFDVEKEESAVLLNWSTTEEIHSDYFEIQRSIDGQKWASIGRQTAHGESTVMQTYLYRDLSPATGINYYRLKMVDHPTENNVVRFSYSSIRHLIFDDARENLVYPNPAGQKLFLKELGRVRNAAIFTATGIKMVETDRISSEGIDVSRLSNGVHTVVLHFNDGTSQSHKIIVRE
ncbi:Por secretion system C-terminal sorting domain-containing protein [Dyadobacter sp. SG02]|uniref:BspA family leucine-rich repeat surface protein n=1 Tax=Dyadobacter sp. SG02 TaxID=1855291 RepID=UPI0008CE909E|nr:BspA family leucine-rich repeat surface protein [Dyadobacter sp. SG02]SEI51480.1 Por secretion system C-terminal sorting domain-containing protein [Dyadobacter sp. SG02]